jgi:O-antigen/teichoic acid export membrane protein
MPDRPEAQRSQGTRPPKRAAGGVVATWVRLAVSTLVGLVQAPLLFGYVPSAELGVWYLFLAVSTFISLSDFGLPATFGRAVAYRVGQETSQTGSREQILWTYRTVSLHQLYASALVSTALLSVALALITFPAALFYFAHVLPQGPLQRALIGPLLMFLAGVVLNVIAVIPGACLSGSGEVAADSAVRTSGSLIGLGLIWVMVPVYRSIGVLCAIYLAQGILALVASHLVLLVRCGIGRLPELRVSFTLIRNMYRESATIFVSRLGTWFTGESTLLIAGYFLGSEQLADLGLLRQMAAIGVSVAGAIPIAIAPHASAAYAAGDRERVLGVYLGTVRYSQVANVLWTLGLLLWGPAVIGLLVGNQHFLGNAVLVPLALASFLELHAMTHSLFVWNVGRWPFVPSILAGGVLNVVFASAGCALSGFPGLVWGSMAAQACTIDWFHPFYALRHLGIAIRDYLREVVLRTLAYAVAVAVVGISLRVLAAPFLSSAAGTSGRLAGAAWALASIVATTLLAAALAWRIMLTRGDRSYFLGLVGFGR